MQLLHTFRLDDKMIRNKVETIQIVKYQSGLFLDWGNVRFNEEDHLFTISSFRDSGWYRGGRTSLPDVSAYGDFIPGSTNFVMP